jgi:hypothetical protein
MKRFARNGNDKREVIITEWCGIPEERIGGGCIAAPIAN